MLVPASPPRIGLIVSSWHADLLSHGEEAFVAALTAPGGTAKPTITRLEAPGALEFPILAKRMAETGKYDAIAVLGFVVDGGIYRHEFVAQAVIDGIMRVSLDTNVPVLSASLTPKEFQESDAHIKFFAEHLQVKGRELASAVLQVIRALRCISGETSDCEARNTITL